MYSVILNGENIELPMYNFNVVRKMEDVELVVNNASKKYIDKCKKMYSFLQEILGEEKISKVIGAFEECDPNDIHILYLSVKDCYNMPLQNYTAEKGTERINAMELDKLTKLADIMDKMSQIDK